MKKYNETTITVRTAIDNCGSKCERFEVEKDIAGTLQSGFSTVYKCINYAHCMRLLRILENYGEGADD